MKNSVIVSWSEVKGAWVVREWDGKEYKEIRSFYAIRTHDDVEDEDVDYVDDNLLCFVASLMGSGVDVKFVLFKFVL